MKNPSAATIDVWTGLSRAHQNVLSCIETSLKQAGMPPLAWYDVLLELDRAGNKGLRAYLLKDKLLLPQYGLSRLLNRVEKAGYLEKSSCDEDGRGQVLTITKSGKDIREKSWLVYSTAMEQAVGRRLDQADGKKLVGLLRLLE